MNIYDKKHLSFEDRLKIEESISNGLRKFQTALTINKSHSTIAKEIKRNRKLKPRNIFNDTNDRCKHFEDCNICINRCND